MNEIFLGKPVHWLLAVFVIALGWVGGIARFHVIEFNTFLCLLLLVAVALIVAMLWTSPPGAQVTRDPMLDPDTEDGE